ncbi:hypothetical protein SAMN05660337_2590 [Maridesulfovibrio ferrireducens]|uniref:Uncharacterized protein n=1 Tax=Maridesulfovibrio ferrireducens TaxID=246191 RepID=A0A1G9J019_9BACT|nr:DUF6765 family protein [Maridesulfovibrio ferrireducens]SDL30858.1 hypothetical protein SAMN05660337_2590 [Maridesulfovibrio ferrireducens]
MQKDMHYYGTYVMARSTGISPIKAQVIASAAQFVDDNATKKSLEFKDGGALHSRASAHHAFNLKNLDKEDQRLIWVPFHFLPGNVAGGNFSKRLVCLKDSVLAREMVNNHLAQNEDFSDELMGVAAHVYADTFSHYDFSGISSRHNRIENDSFEFDLEKHKPETIKYIKKKQHDFMRNYPEDSGLIENIKSWFAENLSGALGHGAACTFPDRPYLKWRYIYEETGKHCAWRDNHATFLEGCEALHGMFVKYTQKKSGLTDRDPIPFNNIKNAVSEILAFEGPEKERSNKWIEAVSQKAIFGSNEPFPDYLGKEWLDKKAKMHGNDDSHGALNSPLYRFYQATSYHRHYVLRDLLPKKSLVVA